MIRLVLKDFERKTTEVKYHSHHVIKNTYYQHDLLLLLNFFKICVYWF